MKINLLLQSSAYFDGIFTSHSKIYWVCWILTLKKDYFWKQNQKAMQSEEGKLHAGDRKGTEGG